MPSRNVIKVNLPVSYYHVYARGSNKHHIFGDESDYLYFLSLFTRYLSKEKSDPQSIDNYQKLYDSIEVLAYCLMQNHFHLLLYQIEEGGMSKLMHGIMTSYSRYFNHKYSRSGPLFESRYKASMITSDEYLLHISRYIHLNPDEWIDYPHSSVRAYLYNDMPDWMNKKRIAELYGSAVNYHRFLEDYQNKDEKIEI
ncbi:MAG: transposase [Candidatus Saccharibacteria bacterium]|nr:transposase [Candidatus Saccharibacteria bacterium]